MFKNNFKRVRLLSKVKMVPQKDFRKPFDTVNLKSLHIVLIINS